MYSFATENVTRLTFSPCQATLTEEQDKFVAEKETRKKSPGVPRGKGWKTKNAELVKNRDEAMTQAKVEEATADPHRSPLISL
jgi:hypothetical protein